jgi:hypothetical protein
MKAARWTSRSGGCLSAPAYGDFCSRFALIAPHGPPLREAAVASALRRPAGPHHCWCFAACGRTEPPGTDHSTVAYLPGADRCHVRCRIQTSRQGSGPASMRVRGVAGISPRAFISRMVNSGTAPRWSCRAGAVSLPPSSRRRERPQGGRGTRPDPVHLPHRCARRRHSCCADRAPTNAHQRVEVTWVPAWSRSRATLPSGAGMTVRWQHGKSALRRVAARNPTPWLAPTTDCAYGVA